MKKTNLFFLAFLTASHLLLAQNTLTEKEGESEAITSPLMMLGKLGEKKATPVIEKRDPRRATEGGTEVDPILRPKFL